jgi:hypothetical protein
MGLQFTGAPCNEGVKLVGGLRSAAILVAVVVSAELGDLRRIDTPEPNTIAADLERIAIDDAGLPNQIASLSRADRHRHKG